MMRITIVLGDQEKIALRTLAEKEFRDPRAQAALIIRQELQRRGLLQAYQDYLPEFAPPATDPEQESKDAGG